MGVGQTSRSFLAAFATILSFALPPAALAQSLDPAAKLDPLVRAELLGQVVLLLGAGLLKRTLNHGTPGRMYVLEVDDADEWLEPLRRVCATPDGRNALRTLLRERGSQMGTPAGDPSHRRLSGARP